MSTGHMFFTFNNLRTQSLSTTTYYSRFVPWIFVGLPCHGQLWSYVAIIFGKGATDSATALKCSSHLELKNGWKHGKKKSIASRKTNTA